MPQLLLSMKETDNSSYLVVLLYFVLPLPRSPHPAPNPALLQLRTLGPTCKPGLWSVSVRILSVVTWLMEEQEFIGSYNWRKSPKVDQASESPKGSITNLVFCSSQFIIQSLHILFSQSHLLFCGALSCFLISLFHISLFFQWTGH